MGILPAPSIYEMDCILVNTLLALQSDFQDMLEGLQKGPDQQPPGTMGGLEAEWAGGG